MCGRLAIRHALHELEEDLGARLMEREVEPVPRYNVGPGQPLIVLRADQVRRVERELAYALWGLIPPWAKAPRDRTGPLINARVETVAEKPSFRLAFRRRRCIIPVTGFYEWKRSGVGQASQPNFFSPRDGKPLKLAGLWEIWHGPAGEVLETACLLTRAAAGRMVGIHDRMPVVLGAEHLDRWLDPQLESVPEQLLKSDLAGGLEAWPVSSEVNSIRNDGPQLIRPTSLVRPSMDLNPEAVDQEDLFGRPWNDSMR